MSFERRQGQRVRPSINEPIEVQVVTAGTIELAAAVDISESGVGVRLDARIDPERIGADAELVITLPGQAAFHTKGKIVRVLPSDVYTVGIQFVEPSSKVVDAISRYVASRIRSHSVSKMRVVR